MTSSTSWGSGATVLEEQRLARLRNRRLRALWLDIRPFALLTASGIVLALGCWGFALSNDTRSGEFTDDLYRSLRLFGFSGGDIDPKVAWQLQFARVAAPALVGYAAIKGLITIFRDQALLFRLRLFARRHIVVVGLSDTGFRLASSLVEAGLKVVVIEQDRAHAALAGCRNRGIAVVFGDGTDPEVQSNARCERALHVFACSGSDATNLRILAACAELSRDPGWDPATAHVFIETPALWHALLTAPLQMETEGLRVDFLSMSDLAGRALVDAEPSMYVDADGPVHLVALARGSIGSSAVSHCLRRCLVHGCEATVTLIGPEAELDRIRLLTAAPWAERAATIQTLAVDPAAPHAGDAMPLDDMTAALVCDEDVARGLATARSLLAITPESDSPVLTLADDEGLARSLEETGLSDPRIVTVGAVGRVLGPGLLHDTVVEAVSRATHEQYVRNGVARGEDPSSNASLVPWDALADSLKESNRRFADDMTHKIPRLGSVVPRDPTLPLPPELDLPADLLETLAKEEHERWVTDLTAEGWRETAGEKDPEHKLHPWLIGWDQLPEDAREKDRDAIRELPRVLAAAGYSLSRDSRVPVQKV